MLERTAVITGATSGIGRAILTSLCEADYRVFAVGHDKSRMKSLMESVEPSSIVGSSCVDLGDKTSTQDTLRQVQNALPSIDMLVLAGGVYAATPTIDSPHDDYDNLFNVNVRGNFSFIKGLADQLTSANGQIIVVNSSIVANDGNGAAVFKSTQHALQGLVSGIRSELNDRGIRISSIYPGQVATLRTEANYRRQKKDYFPERLLQPYDIGQLVRGLGDLPDNVEVTDVSVRSVTPY